MRELIIGIDGGGTKTNLAAVDVQTGLIAAASSAGSIHISTQGEAAALRHLEAGIAGLGLSGEDRVLAVAIGDPAIDDDAPDGVLADAAAALCGCPRVFVKGDVFMAMYAFTGGGPGAFLIAGTGSMGMAVPEPYRHGGANPNLIVGGWGVPTADPGSGYDIAVRGIQAAIDAFDGVAGHTSLCEALLEFVQADSPRELIPWFNCGTRTRDQTARFARCVDACAQRGDETAAAILESAGHALAQYALRLLRCLPQPRIGVYGSVLLHNQRVYRAFEKDVLRAVPDAQIEFPAVPPELGAVMFAADALRIDRRLWKWK